MSKTSAPLNAHQSNAMTSNAMTSNAITSEAAQWLDFYTLLGVSQDADEGTLRARIRDAYLEAIRNSDHRQVERRLHFQVMSQRIIPQARRILLEDRTRRAYDRQLERHRHGEAHAVPYTVFVTHLQRIEAGEDPFEEDALPSARETGDEAITIRTNLASESAQNLLDDAHQTLMSEEKYAEMSPIPTLLDTTSTRQSHDFVVIDAPTVEQTEDKAAKQITSPETDFSASDFTENTLPEIAASQSVEKNDRKNGENRSAGKLFTPEFTEFDRNNETGNSSANGSLTKAVAPEAVAPEAVAPEIVAPPRVVKTNTPTAVDKTRPTNASLSQMPAASAPVSEMAPDDTLSGFALSGFAPDALPSVAETVVPLPQRTQGETVSARVSPEKIAYRVLDVSRSATLPEEPSEIRAQVLRADGTPIPYDVSARAAVGGGISELGEGIRGVVTSRRAEEDGVSPFTTRVDLDEVTERAANAHRFRRGQRVLSQRTLIGLMALTAASLLFLIAIQVRTLTAPSRPPLRIVYASALQPVMDAVARDFLRRNPDIDIELRPMDARDAMQAALTTSTQNGATMGTDVWIPSESLWSDRFNAVAAQYKQRPLAGSRALALSPLVLVARSDGALPLRRRFPNRIISSWSSLREAIERDANGHFGLTDPAKSGSGALARYFMAREWCLKNKVSFDAKGVKNDELWRWLGTVENNVPSYARLTGEMAKDLALGNANRYWWAIVYESDAMGWIRRGQNVEVFYLPQTAYADHPFCAPERPQLSSETRRARDAFEKYLRSDTGQNVLLQNGFRPAEISLSKVKNNPFQQPLYRKRGVRLDGFRVDERINYRVLNSLTAQWKQRF